MKWILPKLQSQLRRNINLFLTMHLSIAYISNNPIQAVIVGEPPETGHSVFISDLESSFQELSIITVNQSGHVQLAAAFQGADEPLFF